MLTLAHLTKNYGKTRVVNDITLDIKPGTTFGFLGPNGAGKTTTIKMLVGLSRPSAGTVNIENHSPKEPKTRERIGFMPEDPYFYDHLSGIEFLTFCSNLFSKKTAKKSSEILRSVGLFEDRNKPIYAYSKGMKQRLGLAQALVNDPDYIFLDEPLDGLDPIGRAEIKKVLLNLKTRKKTLIISTHILSDVEEICDEIGVLNHGRMIFTGKLTDFCGKKSLEEKFVEVIKEDNTHRNNPPNGHRIRKI
jgi:ABC-2 type transport system ATP-binding protein